MRTKRLVAVLTCSILSVNHLTHSMSSTITPSRKENPFNLSIDVTMANEGLVTPKASPSHNTSALEAMTDDQLDSYFITHQVPSVQSLLNAFLDARTQIEANY